MKLFARILIGVAVLSGVFLFGSDAVQACPTCKQALAENDPAQKAMIAGYFYSILFMMGMPFAILGTLCSLAFVAVRRGQQAAAHGQTDS